MGAHHPAVVEEHSAANTMAKNVSRVSKADIHFSGSEWCQSILTLWLQDLTLCQRFAC